MMPNKTIYVKDADMPLFEQAHQLLGESVSSMFADFLKERIGKISPEERMTELARQVSRKRSELRKEGALPQFIDGMYAEAESHAKKSLQALRAGDARKAKMLYYAGNAYYERAERELKDARELVEKLAEA